MSSEVEIAICAAPGSVSKEEGNQILRELRSLIERDTPYHVNPRQERLAGAKDGGVMLGLAIAGVALSGIGAVLSAVAFWGSKHSDLVARIKYGEWETVLTGPGIVEIEEEIRTVGGTVENGTPLQIAVTRE